MRIKTVIGAIIFTLLLVVILIGSVCSQTASYQRGRQLIQED